MGKRRRKNKAPKQPNTSRDIQQCLVERRSQWKVIIDQVFKEPDLLRDLIIWMAYAESGSPQLFTRWKADLGPVHLKLHDSLQNLGVAKGSAVVVVNAFVGWQATPKRERPMWCNRRCLNTDSLRKINRALVNILAALKAQTHQNLEFKWEECEMTEERHKKWHPVLLWWGGIWFCVYLGHSQLGYLNCDSGTKFMIPPDDVCLNSLPYPPNYIVPIPTSSNLSDNRTVLSIIVDEDRVMFLQKRWSPRLMFWLNSANKHIVSPLSVSTGVTVIYQLQKTGGMSLLADELTKAFKTPVCVDINETKSEVVLYCNKKQHSKAKNVLQRLIESLQACIESFPTKLPYPEGEMDSTVKLLMGAGALIHETDTHDGVENMAMLYVRAFNKKRKELDAALTEDLVMARLTQDGFDASHVVKSSDFSRSSHWGSVMFAEYINHAAVSEELKRQGQFHCKWVRSNDLYPKSLVVNFSVERRTLQQNIVCVKVATDRHLEKMKTVDWAKRINATADYCGKKEVKMIFKTSYWNFHGLRKDIEKWSGVRVAEMKHDYAAPQATTVDDLRDMEKKIREAIKEHLDDFKKTEVRIDEPGTDDTEFKGRITLSDGNSRNFHGYDLEDDLENVRLRGKPVWTDGIDEVYELTVSQEAYKVLQREINTELRKMTRDSICRDNSVTETNDSVVISIRWFFTDNDPPKEVKNFAALLEPSVVVGVDSRLISGREKLDSLVKIERSTKTYIDVDKVYRQANIYGSDANKKKARAKLTKLMAEVHSCKNMAVEVSVPLESEVLPKGLALELVRRCGPGAAELGKRTGCDLVELDSKIRTLNCKGNQKNIDAVLQELEACSLRLTGRNDNQLFVRDSECCSCLTEVTSDCLRLENCGHMFCMECLVLQIETYTEAKRFPISCAAEACDTSVSVCDILTICNRNSINLGKLIESSLNCHLARNRHRVRPCPTVDCPMFYNVTADPEEFTCPKCKKSLCSACHEPFHTGLSCDIKREIECLEDKKLKSWIQEQPKKRKMCPKCKSGIEKQMGCSNVHCASCHTYICWLCLKTFKESGDAYAHIDAKHTRRGENDWDEIDDVMADVELEAAEEARVAHNRAAAAAGGGGAGAGAGAGPGAGAVAGAGAGGAFLQNGVGPAGLHDNQQQPVDAEQLQGVQNEMGRMENRLLEVEQAGNVQPHRLQFLRAELDDIRHELRQLENHARQHLPQNHQNVPVADNVEREAEKAGNAEVPAVPVDVAAQQGEEMPRRVLRPRRGGVAAVGRHAAPLVPTPILPDNPARQGPGVNNDEPLISVAELEQLGERLAAPRNLVAEGADLLEELFGDAQQRDNDNALDQPFFHRPFRFHRPGQLLADAHQIREELDDFGRMMERIAGGARRPEEDVQPLAPPLPRPPAPPNNRPVDIGAIFEHLHRQAAEDGDHEVRFRLPFHRPLARLIEGEIVPPGLPAPAAETEEEPPVPVDAEQRPWILRGALRLRAVDEEIVQREQPAPAAKDATPAPAPAPAPAEPVAPWILRRALRPTPVQEIMPPERPDDEPGAAVPTPAAPEDNGEPPWFLRRALRPRRNGVAVVNADQANNNKNDAVPNSDTELAEAPAPLAAPEANILPGVPLLQLTPWFDEPADETVKVEQPSEGSNANPDMQAISVVTSAQDATPGTSTDNTNTAALEDSLVDVTGDLPPEGLTVTNTTSATTPNAAEPPAADDNDLIINAIMPPLVRPPPLNQQQGNNNNDNNNANNNAVGGLNFLRHLMPILDRAHPVANPIPIRRAPIVPPALNLAEGFPRVQVVGMGEWQGRIRVQAPRHRAPAPIPFPRLELLKPEKKSPPDHDDLGTQIQQIIASVQEEHALKSPLQSPERKSKAEEPQPSTSTGGETVSNSKAPQPKKLAYNEEINELMRRREGQEQALIDAMRNIMQDAGDNGEVKRKAMPICLRLRAEELNATRRMMDLREKSTNGGDAELEDTEVKVHEVLKDLENHEQNALNELKLVIAEAKNKKSDTADSQRHEPQPGTSAQTAHEAIPPAGMGEEVAGGETIQSHMRKEDGSQTQESGDSVEDFRERMQAIVQQRQEDDANLRLAMSDAISRSGNDADILERLQPILMRLDTDELTARTRMLEVIHEQSESGLNDVEMKHRLENIVNRQREDERTAVAAMQAVVHHSNPQQTPAVGGAAVEHAPAVGVVGAGGQNVNVRVFHDQEREQRLKQLCKERDAEMAAIRQYTNDVLQRDDLSTDELIELTEIVHVIIQTQEAQQRELLQGVPDIVQSGVKPEEVKARIEQSMGKSFEEEEEALKRMKALMEREPSHVSYAWDAAPARVLRPRRRTEADATTSQTSSSEENENITDLDDPLRTARARAVSEGGALTGRSASEEVSKPPEDFDPFRQGLVRHLCRLIELNRQLRQESLALNVAVMENLPKERLLIGMLYLPQSGKAQPQNGEQGDMKVGGEEANTGADILQGFHDGQALWIPAEPAKGTSATAWPPGGSNAPAPGAALLNGAWVIPAGPRMERRGAIVETDMKQDVQGLQTQQSTEEPQPSTSSAGMSILPCLVDSDAGSEEESDEEPAAKNKKDSRGHIEPVVKETKTKKHEVANFDTKEETMDGESNEHKDNLAQEPVVQVRELRNRVLVLGQADNEENGARGRRGRRATEPTPPPTRDRRLRARASDPGPPVKRPRRL